ncbi:nucleotide exchange factor GrpE [bacterium]|nr:nucleotide exchange factor GrpE [bacterium]
MDYKRMKQFYKQYTKLLRDKKNLEKALVDTNSDKIIAEEMLREKSNEIKHFKDMIKKNVELLEKNKKANDRELEGFKNRLEKEKNETVVREKNKFLIEFIELLGHFEYALENIPEKNVRLGIEMVYNEFIKTLKNNGIKVVEDENVPFDPQVHHALRTEKINGVKKGMVIKIIRKGFILNEKIIRPADCVVSD